MSRIINAYKQKNHDFTAVLYHRKYLGYQKVKSKLKQKNKPKAISLNNNKKDYFPFEPEYQITYKDKYLNNLKQPEFTDISICNLSKINSIKNKSNFFSPTKLTQNKCLMTDCSYINNINNTDNNMRKKLIKKIYRNEEEINKISDLFFFPIDRNPNNSIINSNNVIYNNFSPEEKKSYYNLYKKAHKKINLTKKNNSDINENKNFELNVNNISVENKKINYINNMKKNLELFKKKLNEFRETPIHLKKIFENEFNSDDNYVNDNFPEKNTQTNFSNDILETPKKINFCKNEEIKDLAIKTRKNFFSSQKYLQFPKKMPKYPSNFYKTFLIFDRNKKYEKIKKNALKQFHKKINIREENKKVERPLTLRTTGPNRDLHKKLIKNNKFAYKHESRLRDLMIANKLKCEFNEIDIQRILNGKKPWKDCGLNKANCNIVDNKNIKQNDLKNKEEIK